VRNKVCKSLSGSYGAPKQNILVICLVRGDNHDDRTFAPLHTTALSSDWKCGQSKVRAAGSWMCEGRVLREHVILCLKIPNDAPKLN
jgi:hypothetical protein